MSKIIIGIIVAILVLGIGYVLLYGRNSILILSPSPSSSPPSQSEQPIQGSSTTVSIKNFAFSPASITVKKGTTVTWVNNDSTAHQIVNDPNGSVFKSQVLNPEQSYSYTFDETGTFNYHCGIHPYMKGTITSQ